MSRFLVRLTSAAITVLLAGCSSPTTSRATVSAVSSRLPTASHKASNSSTTSPAGGQLSPSLFGPRATGELWRSTVDLGQQSVRNEDQSVRPGQYELTVGCEPSGALQLDAATETSTIPCDITVGHSLRFCLKRSPLSYGLTVLTGKPRSAVWRLQRVPGSSQCQI